MIDKEIGKRLKKLRQRNKFTQSFVAEKLSISQAAYSFIENSRTFLLTEHLKTLCSLYRVSSDFIIKGEENTNPNFSSRGFIPLIDEKARGRFIQNPTNHLYHEETEWFKIPGFNPTLDHCLFEMEGESMVPTVFPKDILVCQKVKNRNRILEGSLVVLLLTDSLVVKRIYRDSEKQFIAESDNPSEGKRVLIPQAEIKEIYAVRGKISNVLVPGHQMTSLGKIQDLETRIKFLEKELYSTIKKLKQQT